MSEHVAPAPPLDLATTADLGDIEPCGSRQLGRRSSVCIDGDLVVAGLDDGSLVAFDVADEGTSTDDDTTETGHHLAERWRNAPAEGDAPEAAARRGSVVSLVPFADGVLAGERGSDGAVRLHDAETGAVRWRYRTADDVGEAQTRTRFLLPFVVDAVTDGDRAYVASRRYERGNDGQRTFRSVLYAFTPDGEIAWRHRTDASPISLDTDGEVVAVAFNRCPGDHSDGIVVLDASTGDVRRRWDPDGDGDRRAGDVSLIEGGLAVASHADYRGYLLDEEGIRWRVDLARPTEQEGETVYAYPNHVHATGDGVVFLTGNTYPEKGRETDVRHPNEHTAVGITPDGDRRWTAAVGGFTHGTASDGDTLLTPVAQHFRDRDPDVHGLRRFDVVEGATRAETVPGVVTAAAVADGRVAAVEEPVSYHDDEDVHGAYRLRLQRR